MIAVNLIFPAKNAATATSFAALKTAGNPAPNSPQRLAKSIAGYFSLSIGEKFQVCDCDQSIAAVALLTRSG